MRDSDPNRSLGGELHDRLTRLLSVVMIAIGVALLVRALSVFAVVVGVLFVAAGCGRLYVQVRRRRGRAG